MDGIRTDAWVGDAVLTLYARRKIVAESGAIDAEKSKRLTSNQFLGSLGEPTKVEAEIGKIYNAEGLEAAFRWIERNLLPLFERQEENLTKKAPPVKAYRRKRR
jgi:hypothetical protein